MKTKETRKKQTPAQKKKRAEDKIINDGNLELVIGIMGFQMILECRMAAGKKPFTIDQLFTRAMGMVANRCFELKYEVKMIELITGLSSSKIYPLRKKYTINHP